jgi:histidinol phosphatase-like enzyme (inositol monophosphatase family)
MTPGESDDLLAFVTDVAEQAGHAALAHFQTQITVDTKADASPVTIADRDAEQVMRTRIAAAYPGDAVLGEEFGESAGDTGRRWIIDPIDGTRSFIRGVPLFGVMLALEVHGSLMAGVLHFPALRETVAAVRGHGCWWNGRRATVSNRARLDEALVLTTDRESIAMHGFETQYANLAGEADITRTWGDCYGYALVATGRAEVMIDPVVSPWDVAALVPVIEEAGGVITSIDGSAAWPSAVNVVATNAVLGPTVREMLAAAP